MFCLFQRSDKVVVEKVATNSTEENGAVKATESERNAVEATSNQKVAKILNVKYVILKVIEQLDYKFT